MSDERRCECYDRPETAPHYSLSGFLGKVSCMICGQPFYLKEEP